MLNLLKNMFSSAPEANYAELVKNGANGVRNHSELVFFFDLKKSQPIHSPSKKSTWN